ncbi:MAG: TIGR02391 family protein [Lachnospiraceae bacterium]|nr:TIGR02391 family protein [Lachnospiraceae bacterium]
MNLERISKLYNKMVRFQSQPNCFNIILLPQDIRGIKSDLTDISQDIFKNFPYYSQEMVRLRDILFFQYGNFNSVAFGEVYTILKFLQSDSAKYSQDFWVYIHPRIINSSKGLFIDGHYANAAEDAFIEINSRVKALYRKITSNQKVPDGAKVMTEVFSVNNPLLKFEDISSDTGVNVQKGFMEMLEGAMAALRNPKAHENFQIGEEDALRRLMFASMLMYKIDEAVVYTGINE